jgi:hypothetical protein
MKILKTCAIGALLTVCYFHSGAQSQHVPINEPDHEKPKLFSDLPQKITIRITELDALLSLPVGSVINVMAADNFRFKGTVVSKSDGGDPSLNSIVLRSSNRIGATFTFSRRMLEDGSTVFAGRIISMQHGDAFELAFEKGEYVLNKTGLYNVFSE